MLMLMNLARSTSGRDRLRAAGLRVTAPRLAVLDALERSTGHPSAEAISGDVRTRIGSISTQAVYGILDVFTAAGIVRRIEPAGGPARFEARVGDNHHHIVCRRCGTTADIDCVVGSPPCLQPSDTLGFVIDEAEVTFWGICQPCQAKPISHEEDAR